MSADEDQSFSAEELRKRLYQSFKKKGVLDAVKVSVSVQCLMIGTVFFTITSLTHTHSMCLLNYSSPSEVQEDDCSVCDSKITWCF